MFKTLRGKIALMAMAVAFAASVCTGILALGQLRALERLHARSLLDASAKLYAQDIAATLDVIRSEAAAFAQMPPVSSMIQIAEARDLPPQKRALPDSYGAWPDRMARIFAARMQAQPHYTQMRLISAFDTWREVVRVDNGPEGMRQVPSGALQQKGQEPYLAALQQETPRPYFSDVTYNREHGKDVGPATIRYVLPVTDSTGALFGALVINADFEKLLASATPELSQAHSVTVMTDNLDYLTWSHEDGGTPSRLMFHQDPDWVAPPNADLVIDGPALADIVLTPKEAIRALPIVTPGAEHPFGLYIGTAIARDALFAASRAALRTDSAYLLTLTVALSLLALALGYRMTRPIRTLAMAMRDAEEGTEAELSDVPVTRDEVGELASAFRRMSNVLLRESSRSRAIFSGAADAIVMIDETGKIEDANPAFLTLFGFEGENLNGLPIETIMPADVAPHHMAYLTAADLGKGPRIMTANREIFGRRQDGTEVPLEIAVSQERFSGKTHFIGVIRDISARKEAEEQQASLIEALATSNAELDTFAYVASHDLKAPLRVIDNASRWLEEDLEPHLTEDTRESMELLRSRVLRMERLLDDLLEYSRIGRTQVEGAAITGESLATNLTALVDLRDGMELDFTPQFLALHIPRMPLQTVLLNLISNSAKHHDRDTGLIQVSVEETDEALVFTVADDGPGIPPDYHDKVFEMFQTLRPRDQVDGSGMGLAMVLKHVQTAQGRIELLSDGSRGTTFRITWPKQPGNRKEKAA